MIVGICKLALHFPACHSLKEKRRILKRIKDRTANAFHIPLSEVDDHEKWQRALLGFAVVGRDHASVESLVAKMMNFVEGCGEAQVLDRWAEMMSF